MTPREPSRTIENALELIYSESLPVTDGFVEIPTILFQEVPEGELARFGLPRIAFFSRPEPLEPPTRFKAPEQTLSTLTMSALEKVLIRQEDLPELKRYLDKVLLGHSPSSPSDGRNRRAEILRRSAIRVVDDLFAEPSTENISRSTKVVGSFVYLLMKDPKACLLMAQLSSHDPYTLQHSVGTSVNSIILARKIGIQNESELGDIGVAGLLHDVGKVKVKKEIINKNGPLDEVEWEEMRTHSSEGFELVRNHPQLSELTKRAILEHHEDRFGTGYPKGLRGEEIHLFSKIVCLCDIFNALTTDRPYSKARTPFEAFQLIRDKLSHKVDDELFRNLVQIYGGKLPS